MPAAMALASETMSSCAKRIVSSTLTSKEMLATVTAEAATFQATKRPHHHRTIGCPPNDRQSAGLALAFQISFMTRYGIARLAYGTKYQPIAHPGVNCIPTAPSRLAFSLARWTHLKNRIAVRRNRAKLPALTSEMVSWSTAPSCAE